LLAAQCQRTERPRQGERERARDRDPSQHAASTQQRTACSSSSTGRSGLECSPQRAMCNNADPDALCSPSVTGPSAGPLCEYSTYSTYAASALLPGSLSSCSRHSGGLGPRLRSPLCSLAHIQQTLKRAASPSTPPPSPSSPLP
jgi:hypothetical protein